MIAKLVLFFFPADGGLRGSNRGFLELPLAL